MKLSSNPITHDVHYTLVFGDSSISEWREVDVGRYDGQPLKFIENSVADLAKQIILSRQASTVWYHGIILSLESGAFSGEVFEHEGEVCIAGIGRTGLWLDSTAPSRWQVAP